MSKITFFFALDGKTVRPLLKGDAPLLHATAMSQPHLFEALMKESYTPELADTKKPSAIFKTYKQGCQAMGTVHKPQFKLPDLLDASQTVVFYEAEVKPDPSAPMEFKPAKPLRLKDVIGVVKTLQLAMGLPSQPTQYGYMIDDFNVPAKHLDRAYDIVGHMFHNVEMLARATRQNFIQINGGELFENVFKELGYSYTKSISPNSAFKGMFFKQLRALAVPFFAIGGLVQAFKGQS